MTMLGFLIVFPLVIAAILLAVRNNAARNVVVVAASLVIGLASIWLVAVGLNGASPVYFEFSSPIVDGICTIVGIVGVAFGVASGLLVAENVGAIVSTIEGIFNVEFLPKSIYFISDMPSDPRMSDIIPIALFSFLLSLAATLYPSWRAARTQPAEALRYE